MKSERLARCVSNGSRLLWSTSAPYDLLRFSPVTDVDEGNVGRNDRGSFPSVSHTRSFLFIYTLTSITSRRLMKEMDNKIEK